MPKNIEMSVLNSEGSYDVLYPITIAENVLNLGSFVSENDLILSSTTKELLEISQDSTPDDAFAKLALGTGKWGYKVTLKTPKGNPISGVTIKGINLINGGSCVTDVTATSPYYDLNNINQSVQSTNIMTDVELVMSSKINDGEEFEITSSKNIKLSQDIANFDLCLVGAGGGNPYWGSREERVLYSSGGGGGYVTNALLLDNDLSTLKIIVGAGAEGDGGATSVNYKGQNYNADGGKSATYIEGISGRAIGGAGNGKGGDSGNYDTNGYPGGDGTVYKYNEISLGLAGGGGGGGGCNRSEIGGAGGKPYGGYGIAEGGPLNPTGYGGGVGGQISGFSHNIDGNSGYQGVVFLRVHKAS